MARIRYAINDPVQRMTLKAMLDAEGHLASEQDAEVTFTDDIAHASELAVKSAVIVLATVSDVPTAVDAMRKGVFGYILIPFQRGEAGMMVQRALTGTSAPIEVDLSPLHVVEQRHIESVLRHCRGNRVEAARVLEIGRNTLWRKLKSSSPKDTDGIE